MLARKDSQRSSRQSLTLSTRAREMRFNPTSSEERLWRAIRGGQLGAAFRRQVPLGRRYIADFLAPQALLIVEVDGACHARRRRADERRDRWFRRAGYRVLRLDAELVMKELPVALARIAEALRGE